MRKRNTDQPIIIKRGSRHKHQFHGGNWKVAMADFMTSMFIFCLAMWLLNIVTLEQKLGLADYFAPASVSPTTSGSGGVLGGISIIADGTFRETGAPPVVLPSPETGGYRDQDGDGAGLTSADLPPQLEGLYAREDALLQDVAAEVSDSLETLSLDPGQVTVSVTDTGVVITLQDLDGEPMFASGSAVPLDRTRSVLGEIAPILQEAGQEITINGHTDGVPFAGGPTGYTNWELSADRANATRRTLVQSGLPPELIKEVRGLAATVPFFAEDPEAAGNRRIEIVVGRTYQRGPAGLLPGVGSPLPPSRAQRPVDALNQPANGSLLTGTAAPAASAPPQPIAGQ